MYTNQPVRALSHLRFERNATERRARAKNAAASWQFVKALRAHCKSPSSVAFSLRTRGKHASLLHCFQTASVIRL